MLFHSIEFALLLAVVFPAWLVLPARARSVLLLAASYVFYGWWDWRFLALLFVSTATDFLVAGRIEYSASERDRRRLVALSAVVNLGLLGFFKYAGWLGATANGIGHALGIEHALVPELRIVLPVGISFYTFQTLGYTVDVYRRRLPACRSPLDFALYVAFFPQLVAGPIERAERLLPQLSVRGRRIDASDVEHAAFLFASGWLRKSLGDVFGAIADPVFASPQDASAWALLWGLYAFSFQIYLDFSGYTDMARGVARLFGVELMENFRAPYFARDVRDFWRRWHISLSTWLRDYLYVPLGGNRHGRLRTLRNLMITMLLGGLWHGAAWNFVLWGGAHGLLLALQRVLGRDADAPRPSRALELLRIAGTFHLVVLTWLLFRVRPVGDADALEITGQYLTGLASLGSQAFEAPPFAFWWLLPLLAIDLRLERHGGSWWSAPWPWPVRGALTALLLLAAYVLGAGESRAFVYFQF